MKRKCSYDEVELLGKQKERKAQTGTVSVSNVVALSEKRNFIRSAK